MRNDVVFPTVVLTEGVQVLTPQSPLEWIDRVNPNINTVNGVHRQGVIATNPIR